ncbi:MAG TPA: glycosyltransferase family 9 protein [Candidatus Saccharimonadaceae bacterium]|nr:glycosyltransferase family 9 protein [Candidatus Saccharimonadaceae bacterium]
MSARLLALRPRALGDVVLITPALRALLAGHPGATLEVVTEPRYAPLLEPLPGVAKIWPLERSVRGTLALIAALRRRRFDLVVDFFGNPRTALIAAWCGAATSVGYALRGRGRAYRRAVPRTALVLDAAGRPRREHAAATHVRLALAAGGRADGLDPRLAPHSADGARADELLARAGVRAPEETVGLVAAGTWPAKTWPAVNAGRLARLVAEAGRDVLLLAGPGEDDVTDTVRRHAPGVRVLPPCGVAELAAVIARLGAVVGTDSGPIHLAAAFGRPTFAWFGPTDPDTWAPRGDAHAVWRTTLPCRGCDRTRCPHWNCMPELTAEAAATRVLAHLERHGRAAADLRPAAGA